MCFGLPGSLLSCLNVVWHGGSIVVVQRTGGADIWWASPPFQSPEILFHSLIPVCPSLMVWVNLTTEIYEIPRSLQSQAWSKYPHHNSQSSMKCAFVRSARKGLSVQVSSVQKLLKLGQWGLCHLVPPRHICYIQNGGIHCCFCNVAAEKDHKTGTTKSWLNC